MSFYFSKLKKQQNTKETIKKKIILEHILRKQN